MKVTRHSDGVVSVEAEGDTQTSVFEELAKLQEVFDHKECGHCHGTDLKFMVREVEGNKFYELRCCNISCNARLKFGAHKQGNTLFPKRRWDSLSDKEKAQYKDPQESGWLPNNGWFKFNEQGVQRN